VSINVLATVMLLEYLTSSFRLSAVPLKINPLRYTAHPHCSAYWQWQDSSF
jgi:hypothetical protein